MTAAALGTWLRCVLLPLAAGEGPGFWLPERGSTIASSVDWVFHFILWISVFFLALITTLLVVFVVRYRRRARSEEPGAAPTHHTALEIVWSVVPTILVILIFWMGFDVFLDMSTPPEDAYEVLVTGQKWNWQFTYPNGYVDPNLHVPVDRDVKLVMTSEDVIHSFFVPAFRVKKDVVPGRYTKAWFRAVRPGEFPVYCAEYCGTGHSDMRAAVVVHAPGEFEKWLAGASNFLDRMSPAEAGKLLYRSRGCMQCHSVDGSGGIGPTFRGLFGHTQILSDGSTVAVDEDYVRESILEPQAKLAAGFQGVMPTYKGRLRDAEITAIIEYLKTLGGPDEPGG